MVYYTKRANFFIKFLCGLALVTLCYLTFFPMLQAIYFDKTKEFIFKDANISLKIPNKYIAVPWIFRNFNVVDSLLLQAKLPDVSGNMPDDGPDSTKTDNSNVIQILIESSYTHSNTIAWTATVFEQNNPKFTIQQIGKLYGLEARKQIPPASGVWMWQNLYRDSWVGDPTVAIACNGQGTVPFPQCIHHFMFGKLLVKVQYPEKEIENWKIIQSKIISRINSWEISK